MQHNAIQQNIGANEAQVAVAPRQRRYGSTVREEITWWDYSNTNYLLIPIKISFTRRDLTDDISSSSLLYTYYDD